MHRHFLRDAAPCQDYGTDMKLIQSVREMGQALADAKRTGQRIALVPTMGALHEGHVALIRTARAQGAAVVVSIYVNPTQFGPLEDYRKYPRDLEADCRLCGRERVEVIFAPADSEMYPVSPGAQETATWVEETAVARRLEEERRPGHFRGVCTVVAKLLNVTQPDVAVFGQKDYQQFKVIQRMARDLCYPTKIVPVPTVREADGLALSSRNRYLTPEERAQATVLWKALNVAKDLFNEGEHNAHRLETAMIRTVELAPASRMDYAEISDAETLQAVPTARRNDIALIAAYIGKTRLIDNLVL